MITNGSLHRLQHEHHKVPVTALGFYGEDVLLAGEGTRLVAYTTTDRCRLCSVQVFQGQGVHGILTDPRTGVILIYGGSQFATARLDEESVAQPTLSVSRTTDIGDWILDAAIKPAATEDHLVSATLITAHNALVEGTFYGSRQETTSHAATSRTLSPGSNCILYTAHISWLSASQCLIASGTAFGDVILWSFFPRTDASAKAKTQTHFTFSAHEGSVFGVHISTQLDNHELGDCTRALATCSDDRTVRVWDISDLSTESPSLLDIQRDTGFGAKQEADTLAPPLLAKAMGHISRIWHVRLVRNGTTLKLLSFGEDATRITWDLVAASDTANVPAWTPNQAHVESMHSGKNIWTVASSEQRCATGAADGSIALLPPFAKKPIAYDIPNSLVAQDSLGGSGKDAIKSYAFVSAHSVVATTTQGRVLLLTLRACGGTELQVLGEFASLNSYSVVSGRSGCAYIAGARGSVYMYSEKSKYLAEVTALDGKATGLFLNDERQSHDDKALPMQTLLVTTVGARKASLLHKTSVGPSDDTSIMCSRWQLELQPGFVATSFTMLQVAECTFAVLGSRTGQLAVYAIGQADSEHTVSPTRILLAVHGKDTVTCLQIQRSNNKGTTYLYSTGRDGTYAIHRASINDGVLNLILVHQVELPFGPNIEGLAITADHHLRVWGFRSKHFVVHDATAQQDIMTIECGGAHRNWAYNPTAEGGTFIWTKASQVMWASQNELPFRTINAGGHGREIKSIAISTGQRQMIATGAEDTDIKLFTYETRKGFRCLQTLRKHNTGVQHLQWSQDGTYLFSSGGFEELYVWRVCHDVPLQGVGVVCDSKHPSSGTSDLRVMGFDVHEHTATERSDKTFEIMMAYSDSSLKTWRYTCGMWEMLASGDYLTACLTHVLATGPELLTTATDGQLACWQRSDDPTLSWRERHKVHQNAVLDTVVQRLHDGSTLVLTAGDDNGIGISRIEKDSTLSVLLMPRAHAAAVTALAVKQVADGIFWLVSASIDQRVKLWDVRVDTARAGVEPVTVTKIHSAFTSVADVSSASLIKLHDGGIGVLICGVGMDVWRLPS